MIGLFAVILKIYRKFIETKNHDVQILNKLNLKFTCMIKVCYVGKSKKINF